MRTISKSLKYNDDLALVPTGMEGRRLPKKFLKQVNKLQRSSSLTRKVFGTRLCGGVRDVRVTELSPAFGRDAAVRQHGCWLRDLEEAIRR